ncbi:MAG: CARDB domain-containing protein, partial [Candidatus Omnitrophica bacterium]|nr:CARDB domain-containing protein [Candidatus Omnitrophota bacterium]
PFLVAFWAENRMFDAFPVSIPPGGEIPVSEVYMFRDPGPNRVGIVVDPMNDVAEGDDVTNNECYADINVLPAQGPVAAGGTAELEHGGLMLFDTVLQRMVTGIPEGRPAVVLTDFFNTGTAPANNFSVTLYDNNVFAGSRTIDFEVPAGGAGIADFEHTFSGVGPHRIRYVIDEDDRVPEGDNVTNNDFFADIEVVPEGQAAGAVANKAELIADNVEFLPDGAQDVTSRPTVGQPGTLRVKVLNAGGVAASNFSVNFQLDGNDIGTATNISLNPNEEVLAPLAYTFTQEGPHRVDILADSDNVVPEPDEDNTNRAWNVFRVQPQGAPAGQKPDLYAESVSFVPDNPQAPITVGTVGKIHYKISNAGSVQSSGDVRFQIEDNGRGLLIGPDGQPGQIILGGLGPGGVFESDVLNFGFSEEGPHAIHLVVSRDVAEDNTVNNDVTANVNVLAAGGGQQGAVPIKVEASWPVISTHGAFDDLRGIVTVGQLYDIRTSIVNWSLDTAAVNVGYDIMIDGRSIFGGSEMTIPPNRMEPVTASYTFPEARTYNLEFVVHTENMSPPDDDVNDNHKLIVVTARPAGGPVDVEATLPFVTRPGSSDDIGKIVTVGQPYEIHANIINNSPDGTAVQNFSYDFLIDGSSVVGETVQSLPAGWKIPLVVPYTFTEARDYKVVNIIHTQGMSPPDGVASNNQQSIVVTAQAVTVLDGGYGPVVATLAPEEPEHLVEGEHPARPHRNERFSDAGHNLGCNYVYFDPDARGLNGLTVPPGTKGKIMYSICNSLEVEEPAVDLWVKLDGDIKEEKTVRLSPKGRYDGKVENIKLDDIGEHIILLEVDPHDKIHEQADYDNDREWHVTVSPNLGAVSTPLSEEAKPKKKSKGSSFWGKVFRTALQTGVDMGTSAATRGGGGYTTGGGDQGGTTCTTGGGDTYTPPTTTVTKTSPKTYTVKTDKG